VLLNTLRRAARADRADISSVNHGLDVSSYDRDPNVSAVSARIIESAASLRAIPVQPAEAAGFTSFLAGIQRAEVRLYHGPIPIVYAYGAAVVRSRQNRQLSAHGEGLLEEREAVFFPFALLPPDQIESYGIRRDQMIDTSPASGEALPIFPPSLYACAAQSIDRWRESIERTVARRWSLGAGVHEWLLADGTLTHAPELAQSKRAVGLIKSHRSRFFDGDDARVLLGLGAGERTSVFEPQARRWTPVHSWYLRLRDPRGHDPFWGLVRVEIAASAESVQLADQISGWLLAETTPLALPATNWDRLVYPIHECERFLRARAPALQA
jgi:hypothetical protein